MAPLIPISWTTDPEYIGFLNFLIERTEHVESPMCIKRLARDFKKKSGTSQTVECLQRRVERMRTNIHILEKVDTNTKVKLMFSLSASVNADFLKELKKTALVVVDKRERIIHYKATDGSLELSDQSRLEKHNNGSIGLKGSHHSLITNYFKNKNDADAVSKNKKEKEMWNLIQLITEKCETTESPLSICRLANDFNTKFGLSRSLGYIQKRVKEYCREIQEADCLNTQTSVKQLFSLSATINLDYLEKLRKDAHVEVDKENRISYYKANNGELELRGGHSKSAKQSIVALETKRNYRKSISDYFENNDDADAVPKNEEEKEMWNLIEFITRKCGTVDSPLSIAQLTKDFNKHFGISRSARTIRTRIKAYCNEIQGIESLDVLTKIKQLFCLSARLNSDFLQELRKDAVVEVDDLNRITKYTAYNGRFSLHGDHSLSAKSKLAWIQWDKKRNPVKKHCISDVDENKKSEKEDRYSGNDSEEYSSEEIDYELHSGNEDEYSNSIDDRVKLEPFRGSIQEDMNEFEGDEDIQQIPKPLQALEQHNQFEEVPIKMEHEETVEVKPVTSHNPKIKFFKAVQSLIVCLDAPSLSDLQSKIHQKIQTIGGPNEVILNNEIFLTIELLIAQMIEHSVVKLAEKAESVNLSNFLCYLKAAILNSKMSGMGGLVKNISKVIEESQNKRIPIENVANALRATLNIDGF